MTIKKQFTARLSADLSVEVTESTDGLVIRFPESTSASVVRKVLQDLRAQTSSWQKGLRKRHKQMEFWKEKNSIGFRIVEHTPNHVKDFKAKRLVLPVENGDKPTRYTNEMIARLRDNGISLSDL